jgi:hypothetical protein
LAASEPVCIERAHIPIGEHRKALAAMCAVETWYGLIMRLDGRHEYVAVPIAPEYFDGIKKVCHAYGVGLAPPKKNKAPTQKVRSPNADQAI